MALRERADADIALYVGDDDTDEDVFRSTSRGACSPCASARSRRRRRATTSRNQGEIDQLLKCLVALRERPAARRRPRRAGRVSIAGGAA